MKLFNNFRGPLFLSAKVVYLFVSDELRRLKSCFQVLFYDICIMLTNFELQKTLPDKCMERMNKTHWLTLRYNTLSKSKNNNLFTVVKTY